MQIAHRLLSSALVASSLVLAAQAHAGCNFADGRPVVTERWVLDPDEAPTYLGDGSPLMLIAGARLPDGRDAFHHFPPPVAMEFWPRTEGLVYSENTWRPPPDCPTCDFTPEFGWYFGVQHNDVFYGGGNHGPVLVQILSVDRSCFLTDLGPGQFTLGVDETLVNPISARASADSANLPFPLDYCIDAEQVAHAGPGYSSEPTAVLTLADFSLPGFGFGESFDILQGPEVSSQSRVYVHDGACDNRTVRATASALAFFGGINPPAFIGPGSDTPTNFGSAGSYVAQTVDSFQTVTVMARQDQAICYLVGLGGKFVYDTERAFIQSVGTADGPRWALVAQSFDDGSVSAKANCIAYDQRTFIPGPSRPKPGPPGGPVVPHPPR